MSTELDEAKLWYATAPDFDSYPEMLDAFHKHMLSLPQQDVGEQPIMPCYDAGLLSDYGGGNVEWWQDYLRAELNRAHDFYQSWWDAAGRSVPSEYPGELIQRLTKEKDEAVARVARIIAVITPHADVEGRRMTYEGPDIAERFALLSDEVIAAVPSPVGQEPQDETRVELVPNNYDCMLTCSKCGDGVPYYLLEEFDDISFCPNCGHRINKEKHGKKP